MGGMLAVGTVCEWFEALEGRQHSMRAKLDGSQEMILCLEETVRATAVC